MKISTKFFIAFLIISLFIAVQAAIIISDLRFLRARIDTVLLFSEEIDKTHALQHAVLRFVMPANDFLINGNKNEAALYKKLLGDTEARMAELYDFELLTEEEKDLLDQVNELIKEIDSYSARIFALENPVGSPEGGRLMKQMDALADKANKILNKYYDIDREELEDSIKATDKLYNRMFAMTIVFSLLVLLLAIMLALYLSRLMVRPIGELTKASKLLSKGRYEQIDIGTRHDELGVLVETFNDMSKKLKLQIKSIAEYARQSYMAKQQAIKREDSVRTMAEAGNVISSSVRAEAIIGNLLNYVTKLMAVKAAAVLIYNEEEQVLEVGNSIGFKNAKKINALKLESSEGSPAAVAFSSKKTTFCKDVGTHLEKELKDVMVEEGLKNCLSIPLKSQEKVQGIVMLFDLTEKKFSEEQIEYIEILASNVGSALSNAILYEKIIEVEKKRQESELVIAQRIQASLLPREAPKVERLQIGFFSKQARQIGGDFFDFINVDKKLVVTIGDVSGKSIPAALLTAMIRYILKSTAGSESTINPVTILNKVLTEETSPEMFTTLIYLLFDMQRSKVRLLNAGHVQPLYYNNEKRELSYLSAKPQLPLGIGKQAAYIEEEIEFKKGDLLVVYTDGIVEARGEDVSNFFGYDRLLRDVESNLKLRPQELVQKIADAVIEHSAGELKDDMALLAIKAT